MVECQLVHDFRHEQVKEVIRIGDKVFIVTGSAIYELKSCTILTTPPFPE